MVNGVIANIPVGMVVAGGLLLLISGVLLGWFTAHSRFVRKTNRNLLDVSHRIAELLNAIPQAALLTDAEANIIVQNTRAAKLLKDFGRQDDLPMAIDAAVLRVVRSHITETLEIPSPGLPVRRFQVLISPLYTNSTAKEVLVLFNGPPSGSGRLDIYQRLTSAIAHELRTPLTAIMGHVEILHSCRIEDEALWRRSLGFVGSESERLARLVEDLLSLSRLDRTPLYLQPMNLRLAVEEALSALYEEAERKHVVLVLQAPAELPRVQADSDRIRQVFLNLLDNAIKYAPDSTVTVQLAVTQGVVDVKVSDTGPGIAAEDLPHIFEPLYRSERTASSSRGTGLGLTMVHTILDQHNAPIQVQSFPGQGTSFAFSLPVDRSTEIHPV